MSNRPAMWVGRPLPHSITDSVLTTRRQQRWGPARVIMDKTHLDLACRGHKSTWALGYRGRNSVGCALPQAKTHRGLDYRGRNSVGCGLPQAKTHPGLGSDGQKLVGFGQPRAKITRGFGQPWAKVSWVWATMGKNWLGLGNHGQKLVGFGQPWAKIGWVWAPMGKN